MILFDEFIMKIARYCNVEYFVFYTWGAIIRTILCTSSECWHQFSKDRDTNIHASRKQEKRPRRRPWWRSPWTPLLPLLSPKYANNFSISANLNRSSPRPISPLTRSNTPPISPPSWWLGPLSKSMGNNLRLKCGLFNGSHPCTRTWQLVFFNECITRPIEPLSFKNI